MRKDAALLLTLLFVVLAVFAGSGEEQQEIIAPDALMVEYVNTLQGFSLLYPAVFPEEWVTEDASGMSAVMPDGSARFSVKAVPNHEKWGVEAILAKQKKDNPGAETNMDVIGGCGVVRQVLEDGCVQLDMYLSCEETVYHVTLAYPIAAEAEWAVYARYMMNSFTAEALSVG